MKHMFTDASGPVESELNVLGALFAAGRFVDMEARARGLLRTYPHAGVVWKAFGTALQPQRKDAVHASRHAGCASGLPWASCGRTWVGTTALSRLTAVVTI